MAGSKRANKAADSTAQPQESSKPRIDHAKRAKTKTLVLQTSSVVLAAVVLAYFNLIDHRLAMAVIVVMYLTIRFFA